MDQEKQEPTQKDKNLDSHDGLIDGLEVCARISTDDIPASRDKRSQDHGPIMAYQVRQDLIGIRIDEAVGTKERLRLHRDKNRHQQTLNGMEHGEMKEGK